MANDETESNRRERVLSYLYGGMTPAEEEAFRCQLDSDDELARCLAEEQAGPLHEHYPVGGDPDLPEGALQESRLMLRGALREQPSSLPARVRWRRWLAGLVPTPGWGAATAALALAGLVAGRLSIEVPTTAPDGLPEQLVDVRVRAFDESTGQVDLELVGLMTGRLRGALDDPGVRAVLSDAVVANLEPDARLQVVHLLRGQAAAMTIRQSLVQALLTDDNPGVRLAAAEALAAQAGDASVRQALARVLAEDDNPGVRVAAIEALRSSVDSIDTQTRQTLRTAAYTEENEYIRAEVRRVLDEGDAVVRHL
jgi:hypothetical protein